MILLYYINLSIYTVFVKNILKDILCNYYNLIFKDFLTPVVVLFSLVIASKIINYIYSYSFNPLARGRNG